MTDDLPTTYPDGDYVVSPKIVSQATARRFVGQYGRGYLALGIVDAAGVAIDPDPGTLTLNVYLNTLDGTSTDPKGDLVVSAADETTGILKVDIGKYSYDIGPQHTNQKGTLVAEWDYQIGGVAFTYIDNMQILDQMPMYDALGEDSKLVVEQSSWFFADLFDSTAGGPWLAENFQTHFNYERIAQLMAHAVVKMNLIGFPVTNYGVTVDTGALVPENMSGLTVWGTKLEIISHLIRSYVEQPNYPNMQTTYTDRRDYVQRWQAVLDDEKPDYEKAVKMSKRALLQLGRGSLLVSGGIYGGTAGRSIFISGMYSAQVRAFRFYPAVPSMTWGAQAFGR